MKNTLVLLQFLTICAILGCGEKKDESIAREEVQAVDDYSSRIDSLIQTTKPRRFNGVILIIKDGVVKYTKEFGYSNFEKKTPISLNDNFRIQSNSKQITAVLTLREVENGTIDLQKTISDYLPDLNVSWQDSVTVHHLLNMSSGITSLEKTLAFEPGTAYRYSNAGYGLLGKILSRSTGKDYVELANGLFQELGMNSTYCFVFNENQQKLINGYQVSENGFELIDFYSRGITPEGWQNFIPTGGIISNAKDLSIWENKLHFGKLLKPNSYAMMTNYSIKGSHVAFGEEKIGYGYGVRIDDRSSFKVIGHAGKGIGFSNIKFSVPEKALSVIILENIYHDDPNRVYHFEKEIKEIVMNSSLIKKP